MGIKASRLRGCRCNHFSLHMGFYKPARTIPPRGMRGRTEACTREVCPEGLRRSPDPPPSYEFLKAFTLLVLLAVYILFTVTFMASLLSGGRVVVSVDRYGEGRVEAAFLLCFLPLAAYVVCREVWGVLTKHKSGRI